MLHQILAVPSNAMVTKGLTIKKNFILPAGIVLFLLFAASHSRAAAVDLSAASEPGLSSVQAADENVAEDDAWKEEKWEDEWGPADEIADPLEPLNRFFFHFNDKLYYWVLKPVARVYAGIFVEDLQISIRNFFDNLRTPARVVSCLLQGRVRNSSEEVVRFVLNSTVGIVGLGDFARDIIGLHSSYEDLGQTLAHYGAGGGFYINWPFLGPSNFRDSLGMLGDAYMHPVILLDAGWDVTIGAWTFEKVNYTALTLGDYELFTETALDPYAAVKDAYQQYRKGLIENK
jgi:phospholipid-binding lipoprotein MlaA